MSEIRERALRRHRAMQKLRAFFEREAFVEVETPQLVPAPGSEPHIQPLRVPLRLGPEGPVAQRYLHTSPELALKRVIAAGIERPMQVARVFRDGERTGQHLPEFTLVEWYRARAPLAQLMRDCEALLQAMSERPLPPPPWPTRSVAELFATHGSIDLSAALNAGEGGLVGAAKRAGFSLRPGANDEDAFFQVMGSAVEPALKRGPPVFVTRWPAAHAAYARLCDDDERYAERFELYAGGLELANAYDEVTDAGEMRARIARDNAARQALGEAPVPLDAAFLEALDHMPPTVGIALGFERALMWLWQAERIDDVIALPWR